MIADREQAGGHAFQQHIAEGLGAAGEEHQVGRGIGFREIHAGEETGPDGVRIFRGPQGALRAIPGQDQFRAGKLGPGRSHAWKTRARFFSAATRPTCSSTISRRLRAPALAQHAVAACQGWKSSVSTPRSMMLDILETPGWSGGCGCPRWGQGYRRWHCAASATSAAAGSDPAGRDDSLTRYWGKWV